MIKHLRARLTSKPYMPKRREDIIGVRCMHRIDYFGLPFSKRKITFVTFIFFLSVLLVAIPAVRAEAYAKVATISIPKPPVSFDIAWVDPTSHTFFFADRTNSGVDVIDTTNNKFLGTIGGFVGVRPGSGTSGPNGVLVIGDRNELWAGDGDSTVKVVDLKSRAIVASIATGGTKRADELAYDSVDGIILIGNDSDNPPFLTFISVTSRTVVGKISYPNATGLEQPVWNPANDMFYVSVPATKTNLGGEINVIDPKSMKIVQVFPLTNQNPNGLALGPNQQLLIGQSADGLKAGGKAQTIIIDAVSGKVVARIPQVGGEDQVWYNPGDNRYYIGANHMTTDGTKSGTEISVLGIIDAATNLWIENVPTGPNSKNVAVDPNNNHVFVPAAGVGVNVYMDLAALNDQFNSLTNQLSTLTALRDQVSTLSTVAYVAVLVAVVSLVVAVFSLRNRRRT